MDIRRVMDGLWRRQSRTAQRRRILYYLLSLTAIVVLYVVLYRTGMAIFEGESVTFTAALLAVMESFTTTGYGEAATEWTTPWLHLLAIAMQLTGVSMIFLALPVFLAPWVEDVLATTAPTQADLSNHVIICGYTPRSRALVQELVIQDIPYVIIESDRDRAADVYESDRNTVHADPETAGGLESVDVDAARALVADVDDEANASIALTASGIDDLMIVTFVAEPEIADYHRYAGADVVFSPRQLVGESLAGKVSASITASLEDATEIGDDFEIVELPVQAGSQLAGRTVAESGIRERTGTNVVGAWFRGKFESPPSPDAVIDEQTVLLVAGMEDQLEQLKDLTLSELRRYREGRVLIAGYGEVGSTIAAELEESGIEFVVVDKEPMEDVDIVGDITEESTLRDAGIDEVATVVLALADDTATVFATLVVREVAPDVEIVGRADATESVEKLYEAGADYVLALATVSGRMLASTILGEDVLTFDQGIEVVRLPAGRLAGRTLAEADVRARTGSTVIAVERDGAIEANVGPEYRIQADDRLVVAGTDADVNRLADFLD